MLIALDEHPIFVIRIPLPDILVHDGVVVALDGHLLEVVVAVVAAEHRGRALRVDRCLHEVGARVFEVL